MSQDTRTDQVVAGILQLAHILRANQWAEGGRHGLTPTQINALLALCGDKPMRVSALARQLSVTQPTISDAVQTLETKGLVDRTPDPDDARAILLRPTPEGERLAVRIEIAPDVAAALSALADSDIGALKRSLTLLVRELQANGAIVPHRHCLTCRFFRPYAYSDAHQPHHCAFVDAAFGDADLRLDCAEHEDAGSERAARNFGRFADRGGG